MKLARHCLRFITEQRGTLPAYRGMTLDLDMFSTGGKEKKCRFGRRNDKSPDCDSQGF